jgi:hypothetical protein
MSAPGTPPKPPSKRLLTSLAIPVLGIPLLVALSTFWHVPTHVHLDLTTNRLTFTPAGAEPHEILNRSVPFSALTLEECGTVAFTPEVLEIADPALLLPATRAEEAPSFPPEAWRRLRASGPVRFVCREPGAKLTLRAPDRAGTGVGILDRLPLSPGREVIVEVPPDPEPTVNLEIPDVRDLALAAVGPDVELVADLARPEGTDLPFPGSPQTYRARLPESRRTVEIESGEGFTMILTPPRQPKAQVFREEMDLPLAGMEILAESLEGELVSPLRDKATLTYPDFPTAPAVTVEAGSLLGLGGLSHARLRSLSLGQVQDKDGNETAALKVSFEGVVERAEGKAGDFRRDHRLTRFETFRHSTRWGWIAAAAAWAVSTTMAAWEIWKKLHG